MKKRALLIALTALTFLPACATSFRGSAHVTPSQCSARCSEMGGTMAAYVFMGDYSTACVCEPPGYRADSSSGGRAGAVAGAVAGVWMQMQRNEEARRR